MGDEVGLEYVSPETGTKEPSRRERQDQLRRCQVCPRDGVGFRFNIPIFVPLSAFRASSDGDEEETPQLVDFKTRLRFGILGQLTFRFGKVSIEAKALAVSLGTHAVLSLEDSPRALGDLGLWLVTGDGIVKWNTRPLNVGEVERPTKIALWPYVGGRFFLVLANAKGANERLMLSRTLVWGAPMIGLETIFDPPSGWSFVIDANVGGFTVGADVSTRVEARADYHFRSWFAIRWDGPSCTRAVEWKTDSSTSSKCSYTVPSSAFSSRRRSHGDGTSIRSMSFHRQVLSRIGSNGSAAAHQTPRTSH